MRRRKRFTPTSRGGAPDWHEMEIGFVRRSLSCFEALPRFGPYHGIGAGLEIVLPPLELRSA